VCYSMQLPRHLSLDFVTRVQVVQLRTDSSNFQTIHSTFVGTKRKMGPNSHCNIVSNGPLSEVYFIFTTFRNFVCFSVQLAVDWMVY
jgi:hypothetical protein